jgi:putative membrane protein
LVKWVLGQATTRQREPPEDSALDILKKRYTRGEINKEEYEEKKKDLL